MSSTLRIDPVSIRFRRGSAASWTANNPVLAHGEPALEMDTGKMKVGDGITPWVDLPYVTGTQGPIGPAGPQGDPGPTGAAGPNTITSSTTTDLAGILVGDGANVGAKSLLGTTNQVTVTAALSSYTLSLPQDIHTGAAPSFSGLVLDGVLTLEGMSPSSAAVVLGREGHPRWIMGVDGTAESGSNAGSSLYLNRYSDADAHIDTTVFVDRATGKVGIAGALNVGGDMTTGVGTRVSIGATSNPPSISGVVPALGVHSYATEGMTHYRGGDNPYPSFMCFQKTRGATPSVNTIVQAGDTLGAIHWLGADGSVPWMSASIYGYVDGAPAASSVPGGLAFGTSPPSSTPITRMTVNNAGVVALLANIASTSTTTGTLTVAGGAGIAGAMNVGGAVALSAGTASTSTSTGALVVSGGVGISGNLNVGGAIAGYLESQITVSGTTYTIDSSVPSGSVIRFTSASAVAVTIANSVPAGWNGTWKQMGAGQVTFSAGAGATLYNRSTQYKSAGQYAMGALSCDSNAGSAAVVVLAGDTAA